MKTGKFYGVGLGPGDPELVTLKALKVLRQVAVIRFVEPPRGGRSISGRILAALPDICPDRRPLTFSMSCDRIERQQRIRAYADAIAADLRQGLDCAFTAIGDPMTYSTCGYLLRELKQRDANLEFEIVPGVNAWSALAAAAGEVLAEDEEILRIVPSYRETADQADAGERTVRLKTYRTRDRLVRQLADAGRQPLYGCDIGLANQFISRDPAAITARSPDYLSMLLHR